MYYYTRETFRTLEGLPLETQLSGRGSHSEQRLIQIIRTHLLHFYIKSKIRGGLQHNHGYRQTIVELLLTVYFSVVIVTGTINKYSLCVGKSLICSREQLDQCTRRLRGSQPVKLHTYSMAVQNKIHGTSKIVP